MLNTINLKMLESAFTKSQTKSLTDSEEEGQGGLYFEDYSLVTFAMGMVVQFHFIIAFNKMVADLNKHQLVSEVRLIGKRVFEFKLRLAQNEQPLTVTLEGLQENPQKLLLNQAKFTLNQALPDILSGETESLHQRFSRRTKISIGDAKLTDGFNLKSQIESLVERYQYQALIVFNEAFQDQIMLNCNSFNRT